MCAGTPLPRAQRHRDSTLYLCSSLPLIARFPARTCCHMHIATVTHMVWNGGWRRGAGANIYAPTSRGTCAPQNNFHQTSRGQMSRGTCAPRCGGDMGSYEVAETRNQERKTRCRVRRILASKNRRQNTREKAVAVTTVFLAPQEISRQW